MNYSEAVLLRPDDVIWWVHDAFNDGNNQLMRCVVEELTIKKTSSRYVSVSTDKINFNTRDNKHINPRFFVAYKDALQHLIKIGGAQ